MAEPLLTPDELFYTARTVWLEARGEAREGQRAVVHVLINRAERYDTDLLYEASRPWQFSGWNPGLEVRDQARRLTLASLSFRRALEAVLEALDERPNDPTFGSLHYFATWFDPPPSWAEGHEPAVVIGRHQFYNTVR